MTRSRSSADRSLSSFLGDGPEMADSPPGPGDAPPPIDALLGDRGELPPAYARIVRRVFQLDVEAAFERVTEGLRQGKTSAHRREYGELVDELDEASELALLANQLDAAASVTIARYEADLEVLRSDMREQAIEAITRERSGMPKGDKQKTITNDDVKARMAGSYPAEYRRQAVLLAEAKAAKQFVAGLPDQWAARRREIDGQVRTVRKT